MKLAILERDGVICQAVEGQLTGHEAWQGWPEALAAVAQLNQAGWHVVLAAAQPGIGRGLYDCAALNDYHRQMYKELATAGAKVDAVFFCPHAPEDHCHCFAPQSLLLRQIMERYNMDAGKVAVVAHSATLLQAAGQLGACLHWVGDDDSATPRPSTPLACGTPFKHHTGLAACVEVLRQGQAAAQTAP